MVIRLENFLRYFYCDFYEPLCIQCIYEEEFISSRICNFFNPYCKDDDDDDDDDDEQHPVSLTLIAGAEGSILTLNAGH